VVSCLQVAFGGDQSHAVSGAVAQERISVGIELKSEEVKFIKRFTNEVILKRSLPSAMKYFCSREEYAKIELTKATPDLFTEMNYTNIGKLFMADCSSAIDMIPKVHIDDIVLQKVETVPNMPFLEAGEMVYIATYTIDNGASKFDIIYPSVRKIGKEFRFVSRFWRMLYLKM
jgi:hypothetical protein